MANFQLAILLVTISLAAAVEVDDVNDDRAMEAKFIVEKHNELRRQEGSSSMEELKWNSVLADMAQRRANSCNFDHGNPDWPDVPLYDHLGQNLYRSTSSSLDIDGAILSWYNEKDFYSFDNKACQGDSCSHYTQVVWDSTREIGCGYSSDCPNVIGSSGGVYFVCNYGPAGNYAGQSPYIKGGACTQCESGKFWCNNVLCQADCTQSGVGCTCAAQCKNGGTVDSNACTCYCTDGWMGTDCSLVCEDLSSSCGKNPGLPASTCETFPLTKEYCPAMCGTCVAASRIAPAGAHLLSSEAKRWGCTPPPRRT